VNVIHDLAKVNENRVDAIHDLAKVNENRVDAIHDLAKVNENRVDAIHDRAKVNENRVKYAKYYYLRHDHVHHDCATKISHVTLHVALEHDVDYGLHRTNHPILSPKSCKDLQYHL
jgi:hypothetical protein